jgi:hypothetical protein
MADGTLNDHATVRGTCGAVPRAFARDGSLSTAAKAVLLYAMSCGDWFIFRSAEIQKSVGIGRRLYREALKELEARGCYKRHFHRNENGKISGSSHEFSWGTYATAETEFQRDEPNLIEPDNNSVDRKDRLRSSRSPGPETRETNDDNLGSGPINPLEAAPAA